MYWSYFFGRYSIDMVVGHHIINKFNKNNIVNFIDLYQLVLIKLIIPLSVFMK